MTDERESRSGTEETGEAAEERRERRRMWKQAGEFGAIGIELVVATAIGFLLGRWLDRQFDTWPWLALFLTLCGIAAAVKDLVKLTLRAKRESDS